MGDVDTKKHIDVHAQVMSLILRKQLTDLREGVWLSSRVVLRSLLRRQRKRLEDDLGDLAGFVRDVRTLMGQSGRNFSSVSAR